MSKRKPPCDAFGLEPDEVAALEKMLIVKAGCEPAAVDRFLRHVMVITKISGEAIKASTPDALMPSKAKDAFLGRPNHPGFVDAIENLKKKWDDLGDTGRETFNSLLIRRIKSMAQPVNSINKLELILDIRNIPSSNMVDEMIALIADTANDHATQRYYSERLKYNELLTELQEVVTYRILLALKKLLGFTRPEPRLDSVPGKAYIILIRALRRHALAPEVEDDIQIFRKIYRSVVSQCFSDSDVKPFPLNPDQFDISFSDEEACHLYFYSLRWPDGYVCPRCDAAGDTYDEASKRFTCKQCNHKSSITSGTLLDRTRHPLHTWFRAAWEMTNEPMPGADMIEKVTGLSKTTARSWHKMLSGLLSQIDQASERRCRFYKLLEQLAQPSH